MGAISKVLVRWVEAERRPVVVIVAALATIAVSLLDHASGPHLALAPFYLVPVAATAWYVGRGPGLFIAALASLLWLLAEVNSNPPMPAAIPLWNGLSRLFIFAGAALLLSRLKSDRRALESANAQLEQQNEDLEAFAGRVAHDLRNVMTPIALAAPLIKSSDGNSQKLVSIGDRIEVSCRKAMLILDSLLALAVARQHGESVAATELLPAVTAVLEDFDGEIARNAIAVSVQVDPQVSVQCASGLLHIVLANLIGNAVKYLTGSPEPRTVAISAIRKGEYVELTVADSGPGIPIEEQPRIFEPFYRGRLTGAHGSGIGLATVDRIVRSQGGTVSLSSDASRGATFTVCLSAA